MLDVDPEAALHEVRVVDDLGRRPRGTRAAVSSVVISSLPRSRVQASTSASISSIRAAQAGIVANSGLASGSSRPSTRATLSPWRPHVFEKLALSRRAEAAAFFARRQAPRD